MPELALIGWIAFGVIALGGRILLQLRRTGSTGVSGISGSFGSIEWLGGVLFALSLLAGGIAPVLQLTDVVEPVEALDTTAVQVAGLVLYAFGLAVCVGAQLAMGASWRIGVDESERTDLVTDGPFRDRAQPDLLGRHPARRRPRACWRPTRSRSRAFAAMVAALEIQVRLVEEPHLLRAHDPAYREYASRVGRFVPGVGLLRDRA